MLLIRTLLDVTADSVLCETTLNDAVLPFLDPAGALPSWFLIEMMAQSIGVWAGWHDHARNIAVQSGLLLGCRQFECAQPSLPLGSRLRITARKLVEDNGTGSFEAHVFLCDANAETPVASATLTTHQTSWEHLESLLVR
jgi:predicted hotdog family 3-hydroxylacyl-ACP dehydratase